MSGELSLRKEVVQILRKAGLDAQPVENVTAVGCPDVEYIGGWLEIKKTKEWPSNPYASVSLDHDLTKEQRIWLMRRCGKGGRAHVLIQIDQDFLCLHGDEAARLIGTASRFDLQTIAVGTCRGLKQLREQLPQWLSPTTKRP